MSHTIFTWDTNEPHHIYVHRHRIRIGCMKVPFQISLLFTVLTENWQWHIATDAFGNCKNNLCTTAHVLF